MTATRQEIEEWLAEGQRQGATHVIVVCDTFDHDNFPVYVKPGENAREVAENRGYPRENDGMERVDEVYNLGGDLKEQLSRPCCVQFD